MSIKAVTAAYEDFLRESLPVVGKDLDLKHRQMAQAVFPFLRSTFYRWSGLFREICPELAQAPSLLAVGDLHVENFGTWRDGEGRLIWGVNDVDEAQDMPFAIDLVRLATSALLASEEASLGLDAGEICAAILEGYQEQLEKGGRPFVLEEEHGWLRILATGSLRDPVAFWDKIGRLPSAEPPDHVIALLTAHLPKGARPERFASRTAGLGSLGRPRFLALADYDGGKVTREAKAMLPSGWNWSLGQTAPLRCGAILSRAKRCPDPFLTFATDQGGKSGWAIRRLAPHCSRVEMADLPHRRDELKLLRAMGKETANLHLGSADRIDAVREDLQRRPGHWLKHAASLMAEATHRDWQDWRG
jgi:hypothetical protein